MKGKIAKHESTKGLVRGIETFVEIIVLSLIYYLFWRYGYGDVGMFIYRGKYVIMGIYAVILYAVIKNTDGFRFGDLRRFDLALAQWIGIAITNVITYFQLCLINNGMHSPIPMLILTAVEICVTTVFIYAYAYIYSVTYAPHKMLMIFGADKALSLKIKLDTRHDKYNIKELISAEEDFQKICDKMLQYDAVILNDVRAERRNDILKFCYDHAIRVYVVPKITDVILRGAKDISLFDTPIFLVKGTGLTITQKAAKRIMDIVLCLIAMIPAAPVMLLVALAIKLEDGGPVFFKQDRITKDGEEFKILKFRSMVVDAEKYSGAVLASEDDPRITKVGKFIRATRLDEIPQLINILKGDMSVVGPRPERQNFIDEFCEEMPEFKYRLKVKGGLTGYAQIYGKYNTSAYDKLRMDLMYIENYSLALDIKLILTTIRIMFSKDSTAGVERDKEIDNKISELIEEAKKDTDK